MLNLMMKFRLVVFAFVLGQVLFNVFYLFMSFQQGRVSVTSIVWIWVQAPTLVDAWNGDISPWCEAYTKLKMMFTV